jgi:TonB family protein
MERTMAQMGLLKQLTAKGPDGMLPDALKNGSADNDPDKVFSQVGGVGPATGQPGLGTARGGDGTGESKSIGSLVASGPSEGIGTGEKTEKKVRAIVQESSPQDLDPVDLDPAAVAAKIRQYRGALVACYEAALKRNAGLAGKITLRFSISKLGKVSNVEIEVDTMHDEDFSKCIVDRASSWRFPPPQSGSNEVQFAYPFIFQSAK